MFSAAIAWAGLRGAVPIVLATFPIAAQVPGATRVFDTVFVLTNGGPGNATEVLGTYAYKTAFGATRDQGYGAAIGVVIFVLTLVFTIVQWRANRNRDVVA